MDPKSSALVARGYKNIIIDFKVNCDSCPIHVLTKGDLYMSGDFGKFQMAFANCSA